MTTGPATTDATPDVSPNRDRSHAFLMGLIAGTVLGVGVGMLCAPRGVLRLRTRAADSARSLGNAASDRYHRASDRIGDAVEEITRKGQDLRDDLSDAVVRGAQGVERYAKSAKTGH
jgi:gas vesicle protein